MNDVDTSNTVDRKPIVYLINRQNLTIEPQIYPNTGYLAVVNSTNVTIRNLTLKNNHEGILLGYTDRSLIYNLSLMSNAYGIHLTHSSNNNIMKNKVTNNTHTGIVLAYDSDANSISSNNIVGNDLGIYLDLSLNNHISLNNFIGNVKHVHMDQPVYYNIWDNGYPSGGNYWSDYADVDVKSGPYQNDIGSDGIGDSAYIIDANNTDNCPLMGMFSDFNATSEHHVQTVCNSTVSNFHLGIIVWWGGGYSPTINFNVTGEDGTSGFCRICIPTALMNETYSVFVNGTVVPYTLLACSNNTHSYLYFTYNHSTEEVVIIPEFPSLLITSLFMIATLLAVIIYKRKHQTRNKKREL